MADIGTWEIEIGGVVFAGYTASVTPEETDGGPGVQVRRLFRGSAVTNFNRGNVALAWGFSVAIEQANPTASATWFMSAAKNWNGVKNVVVRHKGLAGTVTTFTIAGAQVTVKAARPIGVLNLASVSVVGGTLVVT
jgi:hypothetical protein